ncbi:MAG: beta domain, partial [Gaiellaceae bacterium]|nr:beta domain [Gaiellaceae bacterium]
MGRVYGEGNELRNARQGIGLRFAAIAAVALAAAAACLLIAAPARADSNCVVTQPYSLVSNTLSTITFVNNSRRDVDIDWLNYQAAVAAGEPYLLTYFSLPAGGTQDQGTWLTHPWKAIEPVTGWCLGYTISDTLTKTYVIQPPPGPLVLSPPVVTGDVALGSGLLASVGTYDEEITTRAFQWERCNDG